MTATTKLLIKYVQNEASEGNVAPVSSPVPTSTVKLDYDINNDNNNDKGIDNETPQPMHHLWTTKHLSMGFTSLRGDGSYRLNVVSNHDANGTECLEAEIRIAKQSLGIVLYAHIRDRYYEADPVLFLESLSGDDHDDVNNNDKRKNNNTNDDDDNNDNNNDENNINDKKELPIATVRPLWMSTYKDVSVLLAKRGTVMRELTVVEEQLQQLASSSSSDRRDPFDDKLRRWRFACRRALLHGRLQDLDDRMERRKDTFGVHLYRALQRSSRRELNQLKVHDGVIFDAYQQCRETILGIVLRHQQNRKDAMIKVINYNHPANTVTSSGNSIDQDPTTTAVTARVVTPTKERDGEESVTEVTEAEEDEYDDAEVVTA